jgi:hypothetical protein
VIRAAPTPGHICTLLIERTIDSALRSRKLLIDTLPEERPLLEVGDQGERGKSARGERQQARDKSRAKRHA